MDLNYFANKKILITGGNGFIAYNLIKSLKDIEINVTRLDLKIDRWTEIYDKTRITFNDVQDDVQNRSVLEKLIPGHDIIIHLAAQTSTYIADSDPVKDIKINLLPLVNILDICEKRSLYPVILFSGTATEVGLNEHLMINEEAENLPVTIYDLNKLLAETYLNYYCRKGVVKGATLRLANVYGPGPKSSSHDRGIVNLMIKRAIEGLPLTVYGHGEYVRDYIFIDDVIKAFMHTVKDIDKINGQYFYLGSGAGHTIEQTFKKIIEIVYSQTGKKSVIKHIQPPADLSIIETRQFIADSSKFTKQTNWNPETDLSKGIALTVEYLLKNTS